MNRIEPQTRWRRRQHVIFDCDATLSATEGIDVLADGHPAQAEVEALTESAMSGERPLDDVYATRLDALQPTLGHVTALRHDYKRHLVDGAREVIAALAMLGHDVYIVSGGLAPPVRELGAHLGIPAEHIHAVETNHDRLSGTWWLPGDDSEQAYAGHDASELATADGKAVVIESILGEAGGGSVLIGDGASDLAANGVVDLFIGFGGVSHRDAIKAAADIYVGARSLFPILPLVGGSAALGAPDSETAAVMQRALDEIDGGAVSFGCHEQRSRFAAAFSLSPPKAES